MYKFLFEQKTLLTFYKMSLRFITFEVILLSLKTKNNIINCLTDIHQLANQQQYKTNKT